MQNMVVIDAFYFFIYGLFIIPVFLCPLYTGWGVLHIHHVSAVRRTSLSWGCYVTFLYIRLFSSENDGVYKNIRRNEGTKTKVSEPNNDGRSSNSLTILRMWFWFVIAFPKYLNFATFWKDLLDMCFVNDSAPHSGDETWTCRGNWFLLRLLLYRILYCNFDTASLFLIMEFLSRPVCCYYWYRRETDVFLSPFQ